MTGIFYAENRIPVLYQEWDCKPLQRYGLKAEKPAFRK